MKGNMEGQGPHLARRKAHILPMTAQVGKKALPVIRSGRLCRTQT